MTTTMLHVLGFVAYAPPMRLQNPAPFARLASPLDLRRRHPLSTRPDPFTLTSSPMVPTSRNAILVMRCNSVASHRTIIAATTAPSPLLGQALDGTARYAASTTAAIALLTPGSPSQVSLQHCMTLSRRYSSAHHLHPLWLHTAMRVPHPRNAWLVP
jgi:hypothetical protein